MAYVEAGLERRPSPWADRLGGAAVGAGGALAMYEFRRVKKTAMVGAVTGVAALALGATNSGNLSSDQQAAVNAQQATGALTFTALVTGAEVAALRGRVMVLEGIVANVANHANPLNNMFASAPSLLPANTAITASTAVAAQPAANNTGLIVGLAIAGIGLAAVLSD